MDSKTGSENLETQTPHVEPRLRATELLAPFRHQEAVIPSPIWPGATIGVLGGGELSRMLALAARDLGYRIYIYAPQAETPAGPVADKVFPYAYDDLDRIREFAQQVQVVTFEFEYVPDLATSTAAEYVPVRPDGWVLHIAQNRPRSKRWLQKNGFPVTPFRPVTSLAELEAAVRELGVPGVLKHAGFGYDVPAPIHLVTAPELLPMAWESLGGGAEGNYEALVDYEKELAVVAVRTRTGSFSAFPIFEHSHVSFIIDTSFAPADLDPALAREATELAAAILEKLEVVGLLTVELFLTRDGRLLVNRMAPRTHDAAHLTLDACVTSQFEQQVRAVCSLPLGSPELRQPAASATLLGQLWCDGEPNWAAALEDPCVKLHLYGKHEPCVTRKMGHLAATGATTKAALARVIQARHRM